VSIGHVARGKKSGDGFKITIGSMDLDVAYSMTNKGLRHL